MEEHYYDTPIGTVCIRNSETEIISLFIPGKCKRTGQNPSLLAQNAEKQLMEYFAGERKTFELPLHIKGTAFQQKVWRALMDIPYGETRTYGEIAAAIGNPKASRAVGGANHKNPLMIFVPCHRVIGADGSLVGFGGGMDVKRYLLELERSFAKTQGIR